MAKGLCCYAAAHGDLGRSLRVPVKRKDGTITERCGSCEIGRSCRDPQKQVLVFKFIKSAYCGLSAATKCEVTPAMIQQYEANRVEAAGHPVYIETPTGYAPGAQQILPLRNGGAPYTLPSL